MPAFSTDHSHTSGNKYSTLRKNLRNSLAYLPHLIWLIYVVEPTIGRGIGVIAHLGDGAAGAGDAEAAVKGRCSRRQERPSGGRFNHEARAASRPR